MDLGLTGNVAVVTGGARGIGAAIAQELLREGCDVAVVDRDPTPTEAWATPLLRQMERRRLTTFEADVANVSTADQVMQEVVTRLGRVDVLVCNAGLTRDNVIWKLSEADLDLVLDVNLKGCFAYCRAAARVFKDQRRGRIVNITSINGLRGKHSQANYAASKAGMVALTKVLARELGKFNVTVNAVAPGLVKTDLAAKLPLEFVQAAIRESVLGRVAEPSDVAHLVAFLCSTQARHITGEVIRVDGGQYI